MLIVIWVNVLDCDCGSTSLCIYIFFCSSFCVVLGTKQQYHFRGLGAF